MTTTVDAKKQTKSEREAFALLEGIDEIYAAKGKNVVHLRLDQSRPSRDEIKAVLIGPTGNLRAPTLRKGRTLFVGFSETVYARFAK